MEQHDLDHYLKKALEAAQAGGDILKSYWGKLTGYQEKSSGGDLVTEADKRSEAQIISILNSAYPSHAILGEESGLQAVKDSEFLWAIDPLDGTTNYAHQYPFVAVSIGLIHKGKPVVGVVYNPIFNELFWARQGSGTFLNGQQIHVSKVSELRRSLLATGFAYDRHEVSDTNYREFCHLTGITHGVRRAGSASLDLGYVAAGRLEGFWERGLKVWDIAAGIVLVEEAGGRVSAYDQSGVILESGRILATNGSIHAAVSRELMAPALKQDAL
jgi:myo-inositol-1(or 4)-monophosphatase